MRIFLLEDLIWPICVAMEGKSTWCDDILSEWKRSEWLCTAISIEPLHMHRMHPASIYASDTVNYFSSFSISIVANATQISDRCECNSRFAWYSRDLNVSAMTYKLIIIIFHHDLYVIRSAVLIIQFMNWCALGSWCLSLHLHFLKRDQDQDHVSYFRYLLAHKNNLLQ